MAKNVETRVVEMEFDNEQFEKKASGTLTTLEKLKKSLKFENASSGFDTLQKSINKVSFAGLTSQVSSIDTAFTTLLGRLKLNFFDRINNMAFNTGEQLVRNTVGQVISGGKSRATNIAQAKFKMEGMGVTWEQIKEDLDYAVDGTAYGLDAAANIASQLTASGVELGKSMKTALRGVSGVAAMTSSSYEEIGNVFAAVAGQGKVMAMQLNQLSLRGINAAATLASYLGTTEANVRDMTSKGQIDFNTFAAAMDSAFGEHAKEANKTFTGAMSNIKSALSRIGELFYTPFYDSMIQPLNTAREAINSVTTALKKVDKTGESTATRLDTLVHLCGDILTLVIKLGGEGLKTLLKHLDWVNIKMDGLINTAKSVKAWLTSIIPKNTKDDLDDIADGIENITEAEIQAAWDIWKYRKYGDGDERVKNLKAEGLNAKRVQKYVNALQQANWSDAKAQKLLGINISKTADSTSKATKKLDNTAKVLNNLKTIVGSLFKTLLVVGTAAKDALANIFPSVKENGLIVTLSQGLATLVKKLELTEGDAENLRKTFEGFFAILKIGGNLINAILNAFRGSLDGIEKGDSIILKITGSIGTLLTKVADLVDEENFFVEVIKNGQEAFESFLDWLEKITGLNIADVFHDFGGSIQKACEYLEEHGLIDSLKHVKDLFTGFIGDLFSGIFNRDPSKSGGFFSFISNGFGEVRLFLESVRESFDNFYDFMQTIIRRIGDLFSGGWNALFGINLSAHDAEIDAYTKAFEAVPQAQEMALEQVNHDISNMSGDQIQALSAALAQQGEIYTDTGIKLTNMSFGDPADLQRSFDNNIQFLNTYNGQTYTTLGELKQAVNTNTQMVQTMGDWSQSTAKVADTTKSDFQTMVGTFSDVNSIIATDLGVLAFYKMSVGIEGFGVGIRNMSVSMLNLMSTIKGAIGRVSRAITFEEISKGIKHFAVAIAVITGSILALVLAVELSDSKYAMKRNIEWAIWQLAKIAGVLALFLVVIGVFTKFSSGIFTLGAVTGVLIALTFGVSSLIATLLGLAQIFKDNEKLAEGFKVLMDRIAKTGAILIGVMSGIDLIVGLLSKKLGFMKDGSDIIRTVGSSLIKMAFSLLIISGAIWIASKIDPERFEDSAILMGALLTLIVIIMGVIMWTIGALKPGATAIEQATALLKQISKSIIVITVILVSLSLIIRVFYTQKEWGYLVAAFGVIAVIMVGLCAAMKRMTSYAKYINYRELKGIRGIIQQVAIVMGVAAVSIAALALIFRHVGLEASVGAMVAIIGVIEVMMFTYMSCAGEILKASDSFDFTRRGDRFQQVADIFLEIAASLLIMALAMSMVASIGGLVGTDVLSFAVFDLLGSIVVIFGGMYLLAELIRYSGHSAYDYTVIATAFQQMSMAIVLIAVAYAIMLTTLGNVALSNVDPIAAVISIIGIVALLVGSLITLQIMFEKADVTKITTITTGFAIMALGISVMVVAFAALAYFEPDSEIAMTAIASMAILVMATGWVFGNILAMKPKMGDVLKIGVSLAVVFLALGAAFSGMGLLMQQIADSPLKRERLKLFTTLILELVAAVGAIMLLSLIAAKLNATKGMILGAVTVVIAIGAMVGALFALTKINARALDELFSTIEAHALSFTLLTVLMLVLTYLSGFTGLGSMLIGLALGLAALGGALMVLSAGIIALAKAIRYLKGESLDSPDLFSGSINEHYKSNYALQNMGLSDQALLLAYADQGREHGDMYAEGLRRGLLDQDGNLTEAGAEAASSLSDGTRAALGIASPSKVGIWQGEMYGAGIEKGVVNSKSSLNKTTKELGRTMTQQFMIAINQNDPSQYAEKLGDDFGTTYGSSLQTAIGDNAIEPIEGFGDFDWDYSQVFDDAPITPTVSPVIDAEELDKQIDNTKFDIANSIPLTIEMPEFQMPDVSFDETQFKGLTDELSDLTGEDGKGGLLGGLTSALDPDTLFGEEGLSGVLDGFNESLNLDGMIEKLTGSNTGLGGIMTKLTETLGSGNLFSSDAGLMQMLNSILTAIGASDEGRSGLSAYIWGTGTGYDWDIENGDVAATIVDGRGRTFYQYNNTGDTLWYQDSEGNMHRHDGGLQSIGPYTRY